MINEFKGKYAFLSNFYEAPVIVYGILYPTNEHAFQAQKTLDENKRKQIALCKTPGLAKKAGRAIKDLRPDWDLIKIEIMVQCVWSKFKQNEDLKQLLLATGNEKLIEGNWWGDKIWGVCSKTNEGSNLLGKILMLVREELRKVNHNEAHHGSG